MGKLYFILKLPDEYMLQDSDAYIPTTVNNHTLLKRIAVSKGKINRL